MDAFTRRVELEDDNGLTSPPQPSPSDAAAGNNDENSSQLTLDYDQVDPQQERHQEALTRRQRPFYEGTLMPHL